MAASNPVAESIKFSIIKNGFPEKAVRLPFKPVYDNCKQHGTALAAVLDQLKTEAVFGAVEGDYIVFRTPEKAADAASAAKAEPEKSSWWSKLSGRGDMQAHAKEAMAKLTPDQLAELKKKVESMSDDEKKNIMNMVSQMMNPSKGK